MTELLQSSWVGEDLPVLTAAVALLDDATSVTGQEIMEKAQLDEDVVLRALRRLGSDYLTVTWARLSGPANLHWAIVEGATASARRVVGQWPDPETISREVVAELERVASSTTGDKGTKLRAFLEGGAESGAGLLGTLLGAAIARATGVG